MPRQKFTCLLFTCCLLLASIVAISQTVISPKYSVNNTVHAMATKGDTLILGGGFDVVGVHTGGDALFTTSSDQPDLTLTKALGNVTSSTPDGNGGFYIYGSFKKESETAFFADSRIEHLLPNLTYDPDFSLAVSALFGIKKLLYHNGVLYVGGSYMNSIAGQAAGDLSAINVQTKQLIPWIPPITINYLGGVTGLFVSGNTLYFAGGFSDVDGVARRNIAAIDINTGAVKPWNFAGHWLDAQSYSDVEFYNDKMIIGGGFGDGGVPDGMQHACAITDTVTGTTIDYLFTASGLFGNQNAFLYFAAGVSTLAIKGDTLFAYSSGTFDTRITAINLANRAVLWTKYFNLIANATEMKVVNGDLFVVGTNFTGVYRTNLPNGDTLNIERKIKNAIKLNAATGALQSWYPDPFGDVLTMSVAGNNILIGGKFAYVNGFERTGIVMINTATQQVLPFSLKLFGSSIRAFKIIDSTLYAAGDYFYVNGVQDLKSVMAFNLNTGTSTAWTPPYLGAAFSIEANSKFVFIGGNLNEPSGGAGRTNLFAINRQTGALSPWAPNPNSSVNALHLRRGQLYAGGNFTQIANSPRNYLAAFDTATESLSNWNPNPNWSVNAITSDNQAIWIGGLFYAVGDSSCGLFAGLNEQSGTVIYAPVKGYVGSANALYKKGCYIIAGGNFRINNAEACNNLAVYNVFDKALVPASSVCLNVDDLGGNVLALASIANDVYFGGSFIKVNSKANSTNVERLNFPASYFAGCGEYISIQNGDWNNPATWERGLVPPSDANVIVRHIVTVTANATCFSLSVEPGGDLRVNNNLQLTVGN